MGIWKTLLLTVSGVIEMVFFSGVIYGWANMVLILKAEGYFRDLCAQVNSTKEQGRDKETEECAGQDDRLNLVFTVAVFAFNAAGFIGGVLFDRFGTRVTRLISCFFFFLAGLFSFFMDKGNANLIFAVVTCLAIAGILVALSLYQIADLYHTHKLAVSSSLSGATDSSAVVFLIFKVCYESGMSFRWILITYVIMAIVGLVINTFVFLPKTSFSLEKLNVTSHSNVELGMDNPGVSVDNVNERKNSERSGDPAPVVNGSSEQVENDKYLNGWRCILTCKYLWLFFYLSILQLRLWFFVGSLNTFLVFRTDNDQDKIDKYSSSFGIAQFFGFLFAPLTGIIMDMKPKNIKNPFFGPILSFIIANSLCVLLGVLVLVPVIEVQYLSFVVQVALRAFLYASLISFILRAFPVVHYGKLYGVCTLGGAIISLLQYPAFIILEGPFDGNPFWVNFGFLILSFIGFGLPLYLWLSNREPEEVTTTF